jgi:hypothetical protein
MDFDENGKCIVDPDWQHHKNTDPGAGDDDQGSDDKDKLNDKGKTVKHDYDNLNSIPGSWNNGTPGTFTVWQMLGYYILFEAAGQRGALVSTLTDAFGFQLFQNLRENGYTEGDGHSPYCSGSVCQNGIFNFIANNIGDTLDGRFGMNYLPDPNHSLYSNGPEDYYTEATLIGENIRVNENFYRAGKPNYVPYLWGNKHKDPTQPFVVTSMDSLITFYPAP